MNMRPKTIFCDIDGVLIRHGGDICKQCTTNDVKILPGTLNKIKEWDAKGYNIILVTGRKESAREQTKKQLKSFGIIYDQLIMGIGGGSRVLINDRKAALKNNTAFAINLDRNVGLESVDIDEDCT